MIIIADRIDMVCIRSFISLQTASEQYLAFRAQVVPWSVGWVWDVVFGGRKLIQSTQDFPRADELYNYEWLRCSLF